MVIFLWIYAFAFLGAYLFIFLWIRAFAFLDAYLFSSITETALVQRALIHDFS